MTQDGAPARDRDRPRVLVLATTFPAAPGDGTPEFVLSLARALTPSCEITVLCPRVPGAPERETLDGVAIRRFPYFPRRWEGLADGAILPNLKARPWRWAEVAPLVLAFLWHALRVARRFRPDVIHAHWILPAGIIASVMKRLTGRPYVLTIHGADAYALESRPLRAVKRRVIRTAARAVPVSADIARSLGIAQAAVPMGVNVDAIRRRTQPRSPEPGRFLFVGRLAEKKGADVLIRAIAQVPEASLQLVGDGPDRASLERLAADLGTDTRIRFAGRMPNDRVLGEMRRAHALVIPSKIAKGGDREGTPVVMAEGMAAGVPIIASSIGGLSEHLVDRRSGLLLEPDSVPSLVAALRASLQDPASLEAYAQAALDTARDQLDIGVTAEIYRGIFGEVLARSRAGLG